MTSASEPVGAGTAADDPYLLDPSKIKEPPRGSGPSLRFLGPGMITSAAVVGSGELLTATTLGAQVGFVLLWLVFVSTFVKVAVQIELARWSISTGRAGIDGLQPGAAQDLRTRLAVLPRHPDVRPVPGQPGRCDQRRGPGAVPAHADQRRPDVDRVDRVLGHADGVIAIAIHIANRYEIVARVSTALVVLVTAAVVVLVFGIQATPFAWSGADIASGLQFQIAVGAMGVALSMFGLTGVGAGEITSYSFWCVEKGYAAWTGPNDGSEAWVRRARGWISVMKKDAWVAWGIYTLSTASFYVLGAAVLHPEGLAPKGNDVLTVISRIFTDTIGEWAGSVFLAFAALALYKTIIANVPSLSRQTANSLAVFSVFDWTDTQARARWMRALMISLPIVWGLLGVLVGSPLTLVILGGILNAVYLLVVAVAVLYLSFRETDPRIKDGPLFTAYLLISAVAVFAVGIVSLADIL